MVIWAKIVILKIFFFHLKHNFLKLKTNFFKDKHNLKNVWYQVNYVGCRRSSNSNQVVYTKTLNLPDAQQFELSMKKICEKEEAIKKVKNHFFRKDLT